MGPASMVVWGQKASRLFRHSRGFSELPVAPAPAALPP
jgi:hypothetical protein